jgi:hypothetical protein
MQHTGCPHFVHHLFPNGAAKNSRVMHLSTGAVGSEPVKKSTPASIGVLPGRDLSRTWNGGTVSSSGACARRQPGAGVQP